MLNFMRQTTARLEYLKLTASGGTSYFSYSTLCNILVIVYILVIKLIKLEGETKFFASGEASKINFYLFVCLQFVPTASPISQGKSTVKLCTLFLVHTAPTRRNAGKLKSPSLILASRLFFIGKIYN